MATTTSAKMMAYSSNFEAMLDHYNMLAGVAKSIGIPIQIPQKKEDITPGDNDCGFWALRNQIIKRPEIKKMLPTEKLQLMTTVTLGIKGNC